jgi:hypothetical protein
MRENAEQQRGSNGGNAFHGGIPYGGIVISICFN